MDILEKSQRLLSPKYRKQQKRKDIYLKKRAATFKRHLNGEITLDGYKKELSKLSERYLNK